MRNNNEEVHVCLGEKDAAFKRGGRTTVAQILGVEKDEAGEVKTVYLDRLVHKTYEAKFEGWGVSGAVSTVLHRL